MTTKNMGRNQALVAALTLLGASLGVSTPTSAAETTGLFLKGHDTKTSTQIKGETISNQHKFRTPNTSHQIKGEAPSAMFLKHNAVGSTQIKGETHSNQIKGETHSNQIKGETHSNQIKLDTPN